MTTTVSQQCLCGHPADTHHDKESAACAVSDCGCSGNRTTGFDKPLWNTRPAQRQMRRTWMATYAGALESLGEVTAHPALVIVPTSVVDGAGVRYTGGFDVLHVPTGHTVVLDHGLPLVWLRRFARLLTETGIDWDHVREWTGFVWHPLHEQVRALGHRVLTCYLHGQPLDELRNSLVTDHRGRRSVQCGNPHCEDDFGPAQLQVDDEDGGHELWVQPAETSLLFEEAHLAGWNERSENRWLCPVCTASHRRAPDDERAWLRRRLGLSAEVAR